jgi:hypothetical protein
MKTLRKRLECREESIIPPLFSDVGVTVLKLRTTLRMPPGTILRPSQRLKTLPDMWLFGGGLKSRKGNGDTTSGDTQTT